MRTMASVKPTAKSTGKFRTCQTPMIELFCEDNIMVKAINYLHKQLHHICLTGS